MLERSGISKQVNSAQKKKILSVKIHAMKCKTNQSFPLLPYCRSPLKKKSYWHKSQFQIKEYTKLNQHTVCHYHITAGSTMTQMPRLWMINSKTLSFDSLPDFSKCYIQSIFLSTIILKDPLATIFASISDSEPAILQMKAKMEAHPKHGSNKSY